VAAAFRLAPAHADIVVVHDAARPFATADLVARTIAAAAEAGAAVAALPAHDTVKRVGGGAYVVETLPRETIYLAQTPQAFRRDVLREALAAGGDATDEAALAERAGHRVQVVMGEATNIKVTTADDLAIAETIARARDGRAKPARTGRAGIGYDLHRLVEGRPLVLGGVTIPFDRGLAGHSDADAVCHAVTDAILGAAGAGDIGQHFPDTDPAWKGASSLDLLRRAVRLVAERGLGVGNVDATIILERPKLRPFVDAMRANIAAAVGVDVDRVSVKAKTNEGVGELGRGEAIAVHAIALVRSL
jgi:2-C-methyl-D-erythritol 4-phosphate cytidylyltransferase/2-C-methyl-D-erythritol 2,4-cyclodiphosphate synthase